MQVFRDTSSSEVIKLVKTLNVKQTSQKTYKITKIVKLNADFLRKLYMYRLQLQP